MRYWRNILVVLAVISIVGANPKCTILLLLSSFQEELANLGDKLLGE